MTDRPLGIRLLVWFYWFCAGATALFLLTLAFGEGPVLMNGRAVPRDEVLVTVLPALGVVGLALVGGALALSFPRPWSRAAALFPFVLVGFAPTLTGSTTFDLVRSVLVTLSVVMLLGWYLYARPGPRRYFGPKDGRDDARTDA